MYNMTRLKTVTAVATLVAATAIFTSAASANPFNPFEALFGPQREPVTAPAYANPQEDASDPRDELRRQIVSYRTSEAPGTIISSGGVQSGHSATLVTRSAPDQVKPSRPTPMP